MGINFLCVIEFVATDVKTNKHNKILKGECKLFYPNKNLDLFISNTLWEPMYLI